MKSCVRQLAGLAIDTHRSRNDTASSRAIAATRSSSNRLVRCLIRHGPERSALSLPTPLRQRKPLSLTRLYAEDSNTPDLATTRGSEPDPVSPVPVKEISSTAVSASTSSSSDESSSPTSLQKPKKPKQQRLPFPPMEGVATDISGFEVEEALFSDSVYNHELSWLSFNWRVLAMAMDENTPLYERLKFVAITAHNLDEFFAKRVGGLKRQQAAGVENIYRKRGGDRVEQYAPAKQLELISKAVNSFVDKQTDILLDEVLPALREEAEVFLCGYDELTDDEVDYLRGIFVKEIEPLLTPLAIDPGHPFPFISSLSINLAIIIHDPDDIEANEGSGKRSMAIVNVPSRMRRWKELPNRKNCFVPLEQIIIHNLDRLFGGMVILSADCFIATRNADVERNEEEADDLLEMMTDEVRERRFAPFVRLEVAQTMDPMLTRRLQQELGLVDSDVYSTRGYLALGELDSINPKLKMNNTFEFDHWAPMTHLRLNKIKEANELFKVIKRADVLVQHPYHSFATSTQLLVEAASVDPQVKAIKATLYRTNSDSPIINALIAAAERGIQVAVLVELKARFDEARNVGFATKLEDAGCNVAYGLVGLKTHCKTTLVVREESGGQLCTYCHIGTGNYNPSTAAVYTDFGLLTANRDLGDDVMDLFKYLTGYHRQRQFRKLLVAPTSMRQQFVKFIDLEIKNKQANLPAKITVKVNGLDDQLICSKLYEASQAGVEVLLIVRGICKLRPGVAGLSENIRVISIVGRFLEHHRVFRFENGGDPTYYIGSADWMTRNLMRRVEVATPIEDPALQEILNEMLDGCAKDGSNAWEMQADGTYIRLIKDRPKTEETEEGEDERAKMKGKSIPEMAEMVGVQQATMNRFRDDRRKFKKKTRKASQVVRKTKNTMNWDDSIFTKTKVGLMESTDDI